MYFKCFLYFSKPCLQLNKKSSFCWNALFLKCGLSLLLSIPESMRHFCFSYKQWNVETFYYSVNFLKEVLQKRSFLFLSCKWSQRKPGSLDLEWVDGPRCWLRPLSVCVWMAGGLLRWRDDVMAGRGPRQAAHGSCRWRFSVQMASVISDLWLLYLNPTTCLILS